MASIEEELKAAKAAFVTLSTANPNIATLHEATGIARRAQTTALSSDRLLNNARYMVGMALPNLIQAIENHPSAAPQAKINKAKGAVDAWMKLLQASRA